MQKILGGLIYVVLVICTCIFMGETMQDNDLAYFTGCFMVSSIGLLIFLILSKVVDIYEKHN